MTVTNKHTAADFVGGGDVIASFAGSLKLNYSHSLGLQSIISAGKPNAENSHTGAQTVMNWIGLYGSAGVNMTNTASGYMLNGIQAGSVIGQQGNTGKDSGGVHVHSQLSNGTGWDKLLKGSYSGSVKPTDYAKYMTGYISNKFDNASLWSNAYIYSQLRPEKLNFDDFFYQNSPTQIRNILGPVNFQNTFRGKK